ncbi:PAMP-induced secreted peptide 2 [Euphorbia peplus]|nr:PAMP-induced secreted peptide 2 [Euphorbia peplus]
MANLQKTLSLFVIILVVNSVILREGEARPLNMKTTTESASKVIRDLLDGLSIGAIKESGPSPGVGHSYTDAQTLGGIKDSGPTPGVGH